MVNLYTVLVFVICLNQIKDSESLNLKPYELGGSTYVGYGHKTSNNSTITESQADSLLLLDFSTRIEKMQETYNTSRIQSYALAMLSYNIGNLKRFRLHNCLLNNDSVGIIDSWLSITKWRPCSKCNLVHSAKIEKRRKFEMEVFNLKSKEQLVKFVKQNSHILFKMNKN